MRAGTWLGALALALGCGKQLNPEFCQDNPEDSDCRGAGLVFIDAPSPCTSDIPCTIEGKSVCDVNLGTCVQCTPGDHSACTGATSICSPTDICVGCVLDTDCASGLCLPDGTCAPVGDVLFVSVAGGGTCHAVMSPCTMDVALTAARAGTGHILQLATGDYHVGPLTFDVPNLQILPGAQQTVTITTDQSNPIIAVTAGPAEIDDVTIYAAQDDDAISCTGAVLTLEDVTVRDNPHDGVNAKTCTLTIERSSFTTNHDHAIEADDTQVVIRNNFIYANNNNSTTTGAVSITGSSQGQFRFNTLAFNLGRSNGTTGLDCNPNDPVDASDNLLADNPGTQVEKSSNCNTARTWSGSSTTVKFVSAVVPYDLHLTKNTPTTAPNAIRDNPNTVCGDVPVDIDNDTRPVNQACDLGGDEFMP